MPATAGGSTSGSSSSVITTERPGSDASRCQVRRGRADDDTISSAMPFTRPQHPQPAVRGRPAVPSWLDQGPERDLLEDRGDRDDEERQGGDRREPHDPAEEELSRPDGRRAPLLLLLLLRLRLDDHGRLLRQQEPVRLEGRLGRLRAEGSRYAAAAAAFLGETETTQPLALTGGCADDRSGIAVKCRAGSLSHR